MAILELLIGISIGFAIGIIVMVLSESKDEEILQSALYGHEEMEDQIHESGFIDIPMQQLVFQPKTKNAKEAKAYKKRIERFKLRNRFYR